MPVSARIAWTYLACLFAALLTALLVVVTNASVASWACRAGSADLIGDCKFAWLIWVGVIGFVVSLLPAVAVLRLDLWVWAAALAGAAFLVVSGAIDQVWWWALVVLLPALAALVSVNWDRGAGQRLAQRVLLIALDLAAAIALVVWYNVG